MLVSRIKRETKERWEIQIANLPLPQLRKKQGSTVMARSKKGNRILGKAQITAETNRIPEITKNGKTRNW
jgi:hypothetical protein